MKGIKIFSESHIPAEYRNTPIGDFFRYHNLKSPQKPYDKAALLLVLCMDSRVEVDIPSGFAYVIRTGGCNIDPVEFNVSLAIAAGGVRDVLIVGHDDCCMAGLADKKDLVVKSLVELCSWSAAEAKEYFQSSQAAWEIKDERDFASSTAHRIRERYAGIRVAAGIYELATGKVTLLQSS